MTQKQARKLLNKGENIFLTGAAGSGKTYVLNQFIFDCAQKGKEVAVTASTGIASTHMQGLTIHSWSGIGIKDRLSPPELDRMKLNENLLRRYQKTDVLIIDEISMISAQLLDLINTVAMHLRENTRPFGGMQVVFCGDFFQLPPISRDNTARFAFEASAWHQANPMICYLEANYRQQEDELVTILNAIRANKVTTQHHDLLKERMEVLIDDTYRPTKLFTHNADVDKMNLLHLQQIEDDVKTFKMDGVGDKRMVETIKRGCLAPEELHLKIGAIVMFVKNGFAQGYVNGTLGEVIDYSDEGFPIVQLADGKEITAFPDSWSVKDGEELIAEIMQVPLRLAWAITVHKSQGMSLDAAEIDLSKCFLPGMGYVALSRVRTLEGLALKGLNQMAMAVDPKILEFDQEIKK